MTEDNKPEQPFVHELKANDFILEAPSFSQVGAAPTDWKVIDTFPRDGHTVEVQIRCNPDISRAIWNTTLNRIELEPGTPTGVGIELMHWREIP
jgi:hypothetical protein